MSESPRFPVVFDCNVFAQALINPRGPAGACVVAAQGGWVRVFVSDHLLREIRELPRKLPARLLVTDDRVESLIFDMAAYTELVDPVPSIFVYSRDPDDAHYVDLALMTGANLVVSRDRDLLDLMSDANPDGKALRDGHPEFRVLTPPELLQQLRDATK
jgi:putative PIN family toxin of toxin-antitoxin system